jgi:hypothetical protein
VVVAALGLFAARIVAAYAQGSGYGSAISALITVEIGLFITSASLQAILIAQGMILLLGLALMLKLHDVLTNRTTAAKP